MRKKRAAVCGTEVGRALEALWRVSDFPFGQRLAPLVRTEVERLLTMNDPPPINVPPPD